MLSTTSAVDIKRYEGGVCGEDDQPIQCINALERRCCTFGPSSVATWSVEFQLVAPGSIGNWFKPSSGPWNYCGGYVKNSVIAAESGTICMDAQDITDVDINDGANWYVKQPLKERGKDLCANRLLTTGARLPERRRLLKCFSKQDLLYLS